MNKKLYFIKIIDLTSDRWLFEAVHEKLLKCYNKEMFVLTEETSKAEGVIFLQGLCFYDPEYLKFLQSEHSLKRTVFVCAWHLITLTEKNIMKWTNKILKSF